MEKPFKTEIELSNEEEVRGKLILPYIRELGLNIEDFQLEKSFKIKLGKSTHDKKDYSPTGRADILCKSGDKNLFIFELKADFVKITDEDISQGVSYARLLDQIAPFVIITNGKETITVDTLTKKRIKFADIKSSSFVKNGLTVSIENDISLRYEALKYFIGYSNENLKVFSDLQNRRELSPIIGESGDFSKKYTSELFIERKALKDKFKEFKNSNKKTFLILGESGVGKTNSLCKLVEEISKENLALFYRGSFLSKNIFEVIKNDFNWFFSSSCNEIGIFRNLDKLVEKTGKKVYIFIDAIDEIPGNKRALDLEEICKVLENFNNIKLCVSCKLNSWNEFKQIKGVETVLSKQTFQSVYTLEKFNSEEIEEVIFKYSKVFKLKGSFSNELKEYCKLGFHLKMIGELFFNQDLPEHINNIEITKEYIKLKALISGIEKNELIKVFSIVGKCVCNNNTKYLNKVSEKEITAVIGKDINPNFYIYNLLNREEDDYGRVYISFYYTKIADIIIALYSYELDNLVGSDLEKEIKYLKLSKTGISALLWFEKYASEDQLEVFIKIKKDEALKLVNKYEKIINCYFPKIKEKFEPFTTGEIGISIDDNKSPFIHGYGFYKKSEREDKVIIKSFSNFFNNDWSKEKVKTAHYRNIKNLLKFREQDIQFNIVEMIYSQLEEIIKNGKLNEDKNINFSLEKLLNLVCFYGKEIGFSSNESLDYKEILPLDLETLEYKVKLNNAEEYYKHEQLKELIRKEVIKYQNNTLVYNQSIFNFEDIKLKAKEGVQNNVEIKIVKDLNKLVLDEIYFLKNKNIFDIKEGVLPLKDIKNEKAIQYLLKNDLSITNRSNITYASFSRVKSEEYFRTLFYKFFEEYRILVENNFKFLKESLELFTDYPFKIIFRINKLEDELGYSYSLYRSKEFNITIQSDITKEYGELNSNYVMQEGFLNEYYFSYDSLKIDEKINSSRANDYCIIRNLVYERLLNDIKDIKDEVKEKISEI